jgi:hypothetical protein
MAMLWTRAESGAHQMGRYYGHGTLGFAPSARGHTPSSIDPVSFGQRPLSSLPQAEGADERTRTAFLLNTSELSGIRTRCVLKEASEGWKFFVERKASTEYGIAALHRYKERSPSGQLGRLT